MKHNDTLTSAKENYYFHKKELKKWKKIIDIFVEPTKEEVLIDKLREENKDFILCTNDKAVLEAYRKWQDEKH